VDVKEQLKPSPQIKVPLPSDWGPLNKLSPVFQIRSHSVVRPSDLIFQSGKRGRGKESDKKEPRRTVEAHNVTAPTHLKR